MIEINWMRSFLTFGAHLETREEELSKVRVFSANSLRALLST